MKAIYTITNILDGKFYLGSAIDFHERYGKNPNWTKHHNEHLSNAAKLYGNENFIYECIEVLPENFTPEQIDEAEQDYLDFLIESNIKEATHKYCYNISDFACGGAFYGEENGMYGKDGWAKGKTSKDDPRILAGENHPMYGNGYKLVGEKNGRWKGGVSSMKYYCKCGNEKGRDAKTCINCRDLSGKNNAMYNKTVMEVWIEKYGEEEALRLEKEKNEKLKKYSGELGPGAKLTNKQAKEIRELALTDELINMPKSRVDKILSKKYEVSPQAIRAVIDYGTFKNIK